MDCCNTFLLLEICIAATTFYWHNDTKNLCHQTLLILKSVCPNKAVGFSTTLNSFSGSSLMT